MNDKFDMKLVIDPVTTPLLHARLAAAASPRERAALLRSLAEAALRATHAPASQGHLPSTRAVDPLPASVRETPSPAVDQPAKTLRVPVTPLGPIVELRSTNETNGSEAHDVAQIADEFGAFLT